MLRSRVRLRDLPGVARQGLGHLAALATGAYRKTIGAQALIEDDAGRVLLAQVGYPPRLWNLPGGRVARDEPPDRAIVREVREETGLEVRVERLLTIDARRRNALTFCFACRVTGGELRPAPGEIAAVAWFDEAALAGLQRNVRDTIAEARAATEGTRYLA